MKIGENPFTGFASDWLGFYPLLSTARLAKNTKKISADTLTLLTKMITTTIQILKILIMIVITMTNLLKAAPTPFSSRAPLREAWWNGLRSDVYSCLL